MHYGSLEYYCLGEIVTCILSLILCCNIFISFTFYDRRHRLFMYGGVSSFIATFVNVFAVYCISYYKILPLWLGTTASTVYFLFLCMIPYVLSSYASDIAHAYKEKTPVINSINGIVYTIYVIIVFLNIKTGWIFRYQRYGVCKRSSKKYHLCNDPLLFLDHRNYDYTESKVNCQKGVRRIYHISFYLCWSGICSVY